MCKGVSWCNCTIHAWVKWSCKQCSLCQCNSCRTNKIYLTVCVLCLCEGDAAIRKGIGLPELQFHVNEIGHERQLLDDLRNITKSKISYSVCCSCTLWYVRFEHRTTSELQNVSKLYAKIFGSIQDRSRHRTFARLNGKTLAKFAFKTEIYRVSMKFSFS